MHRRSARQLLQCNISPLQASWAPASLAEGAPIGRSRCIQALALLVIFEKAAFSWMLVQICVGAIVRYPGIPPASSTSETDGAPANTGDFTMHPQHYGKMGCISFHISFRFLPFLPSLLLRIPSLLTHTVVAGTIYPHIHFNSCADVVALCP